MQNEKITFCEGDQEFCIVAHQIEIPDIRYIGLFLSPHEQEIIEFAYSSAAEILNKILNRSDRVVQKRFEIDIPDLWFLGKKVRQEQRQEIVRFTMVFQGLVHHFLPNAIALNYKLDGETIHGVRYRGKAFVNED